MTPILLRHLLISSLMFLTSLSFAQSLDLQLRSQRPAADDARYSAETLAQSWNAQETAIIICDVWDYHHCLNAVRRIEEFVPRLNKVITEARRRGVVVIHSPSDCMDAYQEHPARQRAASTPVAAYQPHDIESWCSVIPSEERAAYPIDQSDGGEDDDPQEHAVWAAKLKSLGRNPNMPWKKQSPLITIDPQSDYISDRGDEVWNILSDRGIKNVILTGVHTNMCVLGRPFGLRQMARNGMNVVLMRDMTDTMYNPRRWPYVSHFEGTRRIIQHIERFVCPTITSDQLIGGEPFVFAADTGQTDTGQTDTGQTDTGQTDASLSSRQARDHWTVVTVPHKHRSPQGDTLQRWYRCVIRVPATWLDHSVALKCGGSPQARAWLNGTELTNLKRRDNGVTFQVSSDLILPDDANLLALSLPRGRLSGAIVHAGPNKLVLKGRWQTRVGDDDSFANMPLPAKFGGSTDIVFTPTDPLWTPRIVSRTGEFTTGIEGPACDDAGNVFAVNYLHQGTIGRVLPDGQGQVFVELPEGSVGNGIRFANDGSLFVADYTGHNVLRVDPRSGRVTVHAHNDQMNQPNDLTIMPDGLTLFASDPHWKDGTGKLWRIDSDGSTTLLADDLGTTNGIEVSPDGKTLYVNESRQRNIWAYTIDPGNNLSNKRLVREFDDHGFDGMRCDIDGNLYVTRHGKGTVVKLTPQGEILREIPVLGKRPTNLCFGGPDGRTVYVTEVDGQRLISFRVDRPGASWKGTTAKGSTTKKSKATRKQRTQE